MNLRQSFHHKQLSVLIVLAALNACTLPDASETSPPEVSLFRPTLSLQEVMLSVIDPNIDFVWNSVSSVSSTSGSQEKQPQNDADWLQVKQHAQVVLEASNLLLVPGRQVAVAGANTSTGGAELSTAQIQSLIDANRGEFIQRTYALHDAMQQVLTAVEKKDVEALENAGGLVEQACEKCHSQFWYPNDNRPK